jgi:hypothetical protein
MGGQSGYRNIRQVTKHEPVNLVLIVIPTGLNPEECRTRHLVCRDVSRCDHSNKETFRPKSLKLMTN